MAPVQSLDQELDHAMSVPLPQGGKKTMSVSRQKILSLIPDLEKQIIFHLTPVRMAIIDWVTLLYSRI